MKKNLNENPASQNKGIFQNKLKILLIEDDPTMRSLLKTLLTLEGFQVDLFESMDKDIIRSIQNEKPDVLIMDIHLRTHNGIDITRSIRLHPDLKELKIIITSGMDQASESLSAGANNFLLKPYMPDELIRILKMK